MHWDDFARDLRYTFRTLRRDKGFCAAAVLIIALGIGANTTMFSVVNGLLFRPLPFRGSGQLVWIANTGSGPGLSSVTSRVSTFVEWQKANRSFEELAAYFAFFDYGSYTMLGVGEPERLIGVGVSQNFLGFLGVRPSLGRTFTSDECKDGAPLAIILTHGLWQRRFGSDPKIIGRQITLNGGPASVVGVLPADFDFASVFVPGSRVDMIVPFPLTQANDRMGNTLAAIGRLKPRVTIQQAQAEFDVINESLRRADPQRWSFGAKLTTLREYLTGRFRRGLLVLLCAVAGVLLIACTNLSNLLLARGAARRKEVAIRSALGASRPRLIRQFLTESLILSIF
jgi:putative ABC transport system permease protein